MTVCTATVVGKWLHTLPSHLTKGEPWEFQQRNVLKGTMKYVGLSYLIHNETELTTNSKKHHLLVTLWFWTTHWRAGPKSLFFRASRMRCSSRNGSFLSWDKLSPASWKWVWWSSMGSMNHDTSWVTCTITCTGTLLLIMHHSTYTAVEPEASYS